MLTSRNRMFISVTEYSSMTRFDADDSSSETDSGGNDVTNAKNLTNVRMIAKQDNYPAPGTEELAFKAGMYPYKTDLFYKGPLKVVAFNFIDVILVGPIVIQSNLPKTCVV